MKTLKKYKKLVLLTGGLVLLWFIFQSVISIILGNVDYRQTFRTSYQRNYDDSFSISTSWAKIRTDRRLFHIANRPTCPGYVGSFMTINGLIDYEYGMFSPGLDEFLEAGYKIKTDTLNNRIVHTIVKGDLTGCIIPLQDSMKYSLLLYPSTYANKNSEGLLNTLANIEFQK